MELDHDTPMIKGDEKVSLEKTVETIQTLAKNRWELPAQEVDTALTVIEKLKHGYRALKESSFLTKCFCWISPWEPKADFITPLNKVKDLLVPVKEIYEYVALNHILYREQLRRAKMSVYVRPRESGLERAFHMNSQGRVFVHLNRKSLGDRAFDEGAEKTVTHAYEIGTPNCFISAGYKETDPTEFKYLNAFRDVPGFVQLVDCFTYTKNGRKKYRALFEYCSGGDLCDAQAKLNRRDRKKIFIELLKNIAFMHKSGYLHRDLKMENILLQPEVDGPKPIVADFGSMCQLRDVSARTEKHLFTLAYISPEYISALISSRKEKMLEANTEALDSWALAIILNFVLGIKMPPWMENMNKKISSNQIKRGWMPEPRAKNSPQHLVWEMIENRLVATEAEKRLPTLDWSKF
jgi:hypothetical protein